MYSAETAALNAIFGIFSTIWLLVLAFFVINIVANWKIFTKANQPGWASIVPFYKSYIAFKIYWGNGWLFLVPLVLSLLGFIPLLGTLLVIASVVINVITQYKKAVAFGQGIGFTIGLVLVSPIFNMILGLGNYQYLGIPQDGYSYDQLKVKYDNRKAEQQSAPTTFTQPTAEPQQAPNMRYQNPNAQPQQPANPQPTYRLLCRKLLRSSPSSPLIHRHSNSQKAKTAPRNEERSFFIPEVDF